jgi:hypothetical protein
MPRSFVPIAVLTAIAFGLRIFSLGFTFVSSDDIALAYRILALPGFEWMRGEAYGYLISFYTKISVTLLALLGISMSEFWWRLPIALAGTATVPVTWLCFRAMGFRQKTCVACAAVLSTVPIHVYHSRYLWGYEVLGFLFLLLFLTCLLHYAETRKPFTRALTPLFFSFYLLSHGYIVPIVGVLALLPLLLFAQHHRSIVSRVWRGWRCYGECLLFLPPIILYPLYRPSILHTLEKPAQTGFYIEHFSGVLSNVGILYCVASAVLVIALVACCLHRQMIPNRGSEVGAVFLLVAIAYMAPILFGAPPGITVSRGYLLIGPLFLLLAAIAAADSLRVWQWKGSMALFAGLWTVTTWGTAESIHFLDRSIDPSFVKMERGAVLPDSGTKGLGYLFQNDALIGPDDRLLLMGHAYEPPNVLYYFGLLGKNLQQIPLRAYYDLNHLPRELAALQKDVGWASVIAMDPKQYETYGLLPGFAVTRRFLYRGEVTQYLLERSGTETEAKNVHLENLNAQFDREYGRLIAQRILQAW